MSAEQRAPKFWRSYAEIARFAARTQDKTVRQVLASMAETYEQVAEQVEHRRHSARKAIRRDRERRARIEARTGMIREAVSAGCKG